ncbi:MAG: aspartate kinase, partial [Porphyromonas sp.]|nr:aspartate kinase [Porphyromonas sp.]
MIVLKFGGTSVGSPDRIRSVAHLVASIPGRKALVLSAMAGTTNDLV